MDILLLDIANAATEALVSQLTVDENIARYFAGCYPVGEDV
jgi:hypothetical protein